MTLLTVAATAYPWANGSAKQVDVVCTAWDWWYGYSFTWRACGHTLLDPEVIPLWLYEHCLGQMP